MTSESNQQVMKWLLAALITCGPMVGCATGQQAETPDDPLEYRGRQTVHEAVAEASDVADNQTIYEVALRYNEPHCKAPSYEVYVYGRWTRAFLEGEDTTLTSLERAVRAEESASSLLDVTARGSIVDRRKTTTGLSYPVFEIQSFDEPESASSALDD